MLNCSNNQNTTKQNGSTTVEWYICPAGRYPCLQDRTAQFPLVRHGPRHLPSVALPSSQASSSSASSQQKRKGSKEDIHPLLQQSGQEKGHVPSTHRLLTGIVSVAISETKEARKCDKVIFLGRGKEPAVFDMQSDYKSTFSYTFLLIYPFFRTIYFHFPVK